MANGLFVSADNYGKDPLIASKATNNQWEKFTLTPNPDSSYTIESQANWKFICADHSGNKPLTANRVETSAWESFYIDYKTNTKTTTKTSIPVEYWLSDTINKKMFIKQTNKNLIQDTSSSNPYTIFINEFIKYQKIDGFGASLTDSSAWLLKNQLSDTKRAEILEKLFGVTGIRLSLLRQTIGSTDFAWESWSFSDPWGQLDDFKLNSFSLWREDAYIRPVLDQALKISNGRVKLFASPWSPPAWMKTQKHLFGTLGGSLRSDCYDVYADYFVKYLIGNQNRNSEIYGITVQNEPLYEPTKYPGMKMTTTEHINFIKNNLAPKIKSAKLKTKILVYDHNYDDYDYANTVTSELSDYLSGVGFHHYTDKHESSILEYKVNNQNKDIWITEAGFGRWIGSGSDNDQFQSQMSRLIRTTRYWSRGFLMWNVALDEKSHPNIIDDFSSNIGLITIKSSIKDNVSFERGFYSLGHFSKFVDPNAVRISTNTFSNDVENVAFLNPDNTIVLVVSNRVIQLRKIKIKWRNLSFEADLQPLAAATFKFSVQ